MSFIETIGNNRLALYLRYLVYPPSINLYITPNKTIILGMSPSVPGIYNVLNIHE